MRKHYTRSKAVGNLKRLYRMICFKPSPKENIINTSSITRFVFIR